MVLSIQTLCCDTHIFNHFHWLNTPFLLIILEMVLHLHLSPAVFDYTDWTWLGKPHTCLYKTLQLTVHVRANENHEVKGTAWRAQRQNCGKAQIWPRLQKNSAALKVPKSTVASIILKWKTFGTTRTLPRAGGPAKLSYRGRRALVREVKKNPKITVAELQRCIREMGESCRKSTITAALHQSGLYGRVARRKPLLSARHMKARMEFAKKHLKDSKMVTNKILWSDETKIELFGLNSKRYVWRKTRHCSSPVQYSPNSEAWLWQHHAVGVFFSCRDRTTGCNRGKDECGQVQGYPGWKPSPECSGPQTGPKVYLPTRQWP